MWKKRSETTWERGVMVKLISKTSSGIRSISKTVGGFLGFMKTRKEKKRRSITCHTDGANKANTEDVYYMALLIITGKERNHLSF